VQQALPHKTSGQVSRLLKRLRVHGLLKKVGRRYKYYLTDLGRQVAALALKLREIVVIPMLAQPAMA
jgi:DNA-binding IclR family transcriptional regulator